VDLTNDIAWPRIEYKPVRFNKSKTPQLAIDKTKNIFIILYANSSRKSNSIRSMGAYV
jgi:hypothetical protein